MPSITPWFTPRSPASGSIDTCPGYGDPMETGLVVQVPLFVNENDRIKVNTGSGEYQERA